MVLVDEDGNIVDEEGNVLGRASDLEEEDPAMTEAEKEADRLMEAAAGLWREGQQEDAVGKMEEALQAVSGDDARPEVVSEVASSLADMLYAIQQFERAQAAVEVAMASAERAGQYELLIKLANNLGAVLRKLDKPEEVRELHQRAMDVAIRNLGHAHPFAALARGNLVEALDELGEVDQARQLLRGFIDVLLKEAADKAVEAEQAQSEGDAAPADTAAPAGDAGTPRSSTNGLGPVKAAKLGAVRAYVELGRLETKHKEYEVAEAALRDALAICTEIYGEDAPEAASVVASLASMHRQAGNAEAATVEYSRLFALTESANGLAHQNTVMLARTLVEMFEEMGEHQESVKYARKALEGMQGLLGSPIHPYLEPFFSALINALVKAGDAEGAEHVKSDFTRGMAALQQQAIARGGATRGGRGGRAGRRGRR